MTKTERSFRIKAVQVCVTVHFYPFNLSRSWNRGPDQKSVIRYTGRTYKSWPSWFGRIRVVGNTKYDFVRRIRLRRLCRSRKRFGKGASRR